jgi:hypothetical protein
LHVSTPFAAGSQRVSSPLHSEGASTPASVVAPPLVEADVLDWLEVDVLVDDDGVDMLDELETDVLSLLLDDCVVE